MVIDPVTTFLNNPQSPYTSRSTVLIPSEAHPQLREQLLSEAHTAGLAAETIEQLVAELKEAGFTESAINEDGTSYVRVTPPNEQAFSRMFNDTGWRPGDD